MIKLFEMFAGYGGASFALKKAGIEHEVVGYSEIDKYAIQCYEQNHKGKNFGDCTKINPNEIPDFDLLTGGFPCQSFSVAGKGLGELDPRGTLFYEIIRIAEVKKPRYMLLENVKGLTNKNHRPTFEKILSELARIGYYVKWKILNTKDYGIPQNRERVWFVCFKEESDYYKFKFPEKEELKIFIKDILEPEVDKKYFLSELLQERFRKYLEDKENKLLLAPKNFNHKAGDGIKTRERYQTDISPSLQAQAGGTQQTYTQDISNTITSVQKDNLIIAGILGERFGSCNTVLETESISQTLSASMGLGGGYVPKIYDRKGFDSRTKGFRENELSPTLSTKMGTGGNNVPMVQAQISNCSPREVGFKDLSPCLAARDYKDPKIVSNAITTAVGRIGHSKEELGYIENNMKAGQLRRLTPKECFRLQGFLNDEVNLEGLSDTQKYKLAGNGWDINLVSRLFKAMFNSIVPPSNFPTEFSYGKTTLNNNITK